MPDWLQGINANFAGYGSVAVILLLAFLGFRVARRIVQMGYLAFFSVIGFAVVYGACAYSARSLQVPLAIPIAGGLAFGLAASAIRAKIMRVVLGATLVALFSVGGQFWSRFAGQPQSSGTPAQEGLGLAKRRFAEIAPDLPRVQGKIAPGWIASRQLGRIGIATPLQESAQEPAWHTWLTGLRDDKGGDMGLWTQGGTLEHSRASLQLRRRGSSTQPESP